MSGLEYAGLATVVELGDGGALLCPAGDVLGGANFWVPTGELPEVAAGTVLAVELLHDGAEGWLIDARPVGNATPHSVTATGAGWRFGTGRARTTIPFPDAGLTRQELDALSGCPFWEFDDHIAGSALGHFQDARGYLEQRGQQRAKRQQEREDHQWRAARAFASDRFVNPYNFVPLPAVPPAKSILPGHAARRADLLHGRIDISLTTLTPLLVRDADGPREEGQVLRLPRRDGRNVVPGTSLKGALRSAFETLTGSCLRVIDLDFVPAYRDVLRATNKRQWRLIEVQDVDQQHRPTQALVCDRPIWVSLPVLQSVLGRGGVRTGARFRLVGTPQRIGERDEVRDPGDVTPVSAQGGDEYVLLVTDVRPRPAGKGVTFVAGRVPDSPSEVVVDSAAWRRFEAASDGARDNSRGTTRNLSDTIDLSINKADRGPAQRQRQGLADPKARVGLRPGHVLWALADRQQDQTVITELSFAHTWRHAARGDSASTRDRTPPGFHPCRGDDNTLCPACRVFGSADVAGARGAIKGTHPYRGHVRVGELTIDGATSEVDLPASGQPRPGAGQMYLAHTTVPTGEAARGRIGQDPLREWGSALDADGTRLIRGRKFYWRAGDAPGRPPRWQKHASQVGEENQGTMLTRAEVADPGATLSGTLTFENLTHAELGAVLASLDPGLLKEHQHRARAGQDGQFCISVGGGKPLGLGACHVEQVTVTLEGAADRYRDGNPYSGDVAELVAAFSAQAAAEVRATWPDFLELVRFNALDPALVSYPRETPWPEDPNNPQISKAGFDWWKWSAGMPWDGLASKDPDEHDKHTYVTLPTATDPDPRLPIQPDGVAAPESILDQLRRPAQGGGHR